jgi:hypothetical protein
MNAPAMIDWVSPSALSRLQACGLAESRRTTGAATTTPPSNPVTRLGNAAHRTLEWVVNHAPDIVAGRDAETRIAERWAEEVAAEVRASELHPLERSYGPAERWPSYGRIAAGVRADGADLAREVAHLPAERRLAEKELSAEGGMIRGTADLLLIDAGGAATIIDHKTGAASEEDVAVGGRYEQQVLLYVVMARASGFRPTRAEIRPLGQAPVQVEFPEGRLVEVVEEARSQVERYNTAVEAGRAVDLAAPSESSCGWCPYALDCPALWGVVALDLGDFFLVEGEIEAVQVLTNSIALKLRTADGAILVSGVPRSTRHEAATAPGARLRLTGLHQATPENFRFRVGRTLMSMV